MGFCLLKLFALFCCVFSPSILKVAADISPSNSALLGFVQSHQDPRYRIEYLSPGSRIQRDADQETVLMVDGEKRKYECILPKQAEQQSLKDESSQQNSSSVSLMTERRVSKTPDDLLALLKDQYFIRVVQEFELGTYDPKATALFHQNFSDVLLQKDHRSKSAAQRYHSHILTNGTLCDLTSEPRETEVRFICSDTGSNMISSITEVSTCKYTLAFHTPILCKHPLFQEEKPRFLTIECEEVPPSSEVVEDDVLSGLPPSKNVNDQ